MWQMQLLATVLVYHPLWMVKIHPPRGGGGQLAFDREGGRECWALGQAAWAPRALVWKVTTHQGPKEVKAMQGSLTKSLMEFLARISFQKFLYCLPFSSW